MPPGNKMRDILKNLFAATYNLCLISSMMTTAVHARCHSAAKTVDKNADVIYNI
jgi:hypothetical protein